MALPDELANAVWKRDGYKCKRCGKQMKPEDEGKRLDLHHKFDPGAGRHTNEMKNIVTLCDKCHDDLHQKGKVTP